MQKFLRKYSISIFSICLFFFLIFGVESSSAESKIQKDKIKISRESLHAQMSSLLQSTFKQWYPLSIDTVYGGFFSDINYKWKLEGDQNKMIVTQARHVWTNANASIFYGKKEPFFRTATHGYKFLRNVMYDKKYGGFYNLVNRRGKPIEDNGKIIKQIYGTAFAIYGLAGYYAAFKDKSALNLAIKTFRWMDTHSYDPKYGGYFQFLTREGKPFINGYENTPPKDQNSMIHIMECFTELYRVWPDPLLRKRLYSLFHLVRDTVVGDKGYMTLFFKRDWTPVSYRDSSERSRRRHFELDHISFGHDVETAYLLLDASKALGIKNDTTTLRIAKQLDDFALDNGWDNKKGGIYDGGYIFKGEKKVTIILKTKEWWSQIEALNSFFMMSVYYPNDNHNYYDKFLTQWHYIKEFCIDHKYGGWYWGGIDEAPKNQFAPKATIWKANYHTTRGLINCLRRLKDDKAIEWK